ncbi:hypothetical protein [Nocardia sp. NPDC005825]|uniref:hypothetical protein n=1 Tax=unclassified Nocardia TaxID=2637762 RepID=UPI0033E89925
MTKWVRGRRTLVAVLVLAVVGGLAAGGVAGVRWWQHGHPGTNPFTGPRNLAGGLVHDFPAIDSTGLTAAQNRVVDVLRQQFEEQSGRDKYSEGIAEPWCADFVSWVMRAAGQPLHNPNSGSWRIPGVYTLEEYYRGSTVSRRRTQVFYRVSETLSCTPIPVCSISTQIL